MCTGRVDLGFVLRAFQKGADGVIIGGCWPGECHYVTEGNYDALGNMHLCKKLLVHMGINPARLRLEWISASQGIRFAEVMSEFASGMRQLGALGRAEGIEEAVLQRKLDAAAALVPYIKLVEREKLRVPRKSEEAYNAFYASEEVSRLFGELIADKLAIVEILQLLKEGPLSTAEISKKLGLSSTEVARHMKRSSSHHLVTYDQSRGSYALSSI